MALKYGGKTISDYSAMRGPCPEGFHIPKSSERSAVINAGVSLGARTTSGTTSVTNFRTYLKLPNIVYLFPGNGLPGTGWTPQHRYYWGCRQTGSDGSGRYCDALDVVEDYGGSIGVENTSSNHGCPVRPFKDKPVIPDSSRTTLYTSDVYPASRNIKHSQSLGLITISYDGTYITIADKNAGATSVYNFGDTITSANGGGLYQWGNNYPFSINGATTTSSTRVDTTGYGPGNYYSGSTFITGGVNDDWFSPRNRDLWGGMTGIQQKPVDIIERYYGGKTISDYSAMRGPCSEGFHIPLDFEWVNVSNILHGFGMSYMDIVADLHLPIAGWRIPNDGTFSSNSVYYRCSKVLNGNYLGQCFRIDTYTGTAIVTTQGEDTGGSLRPFHDGFVVPNSNWTVIRSSGDGGIFWNQTDGLISITSDGISGYTIADKNVGATVVYNNGNALSEANCGKFFQWGNNYGFPYSGNITTSSTKVNATGYGPGNYYYSSTFITNLESGTSWMNPINPNLRGGVTGIQYHIAKVKEVYYNTTKIWPKYSQIIIESDLTNSTLYSLQNDGWTDIYSSTGTYRLNSNGFAGPEQNNIQAILYKDISEYIDEINEVKNLSLEFDAYGENDTYSGRVECGLRNAVTGSSVYSDIIMGYSSSSSYRYTTINWGPPATTNKTTVNRNGLYHIIFTYNIDTGVVSGNITQSGSSVYSKTYTVSENTRTQIKNNIKILYFSTNRGGNPAGDTTYIKNVKLVVNFN